MIFALRGDVIRRKWPPKGGWIYHEPATGWSTKTPMSDNFDSTVQKIIQHRLANRAYNLSVDRMDVELALMDQTAQRIIKEAPEHVTEWVVPVDDEAKKKSQAQKPSPPRRAAADVLHAAPSAVDRILGRIRSIARGAATLADWIGDGAVPVSPFVADRRGAICAGCPMNRPADDFADVVTGSIAEAISAQTIVKNAAGLASAHEDKLGFCDACGCPLRLKVWVPLHTIKARTEQETMDAFHPACWIRNEGATASSSGVPRPVFARTIVIQRRAAFGDVIMATIVASKLRDVGIGVRMLTEPIISRALEGHPAVQEWGNPGDCDVNLDRTYEDNMERDRKPIPRLMMDAAIPQIDRLGIQLADTVNLVPVLGISDDERWAAAKELQDMARPRIVLVDASGSWPNRTWKKSQVESFPSKMAGLGQVIWSKPSRWSGQPDGVSKLEIRNFRHLMAIISQADIVVTPDTGPLHVAAAFDKPVIALEQCNRVGLRLTNLTDWTSVAPSLDCIGCSKFDCPIDAKAPPCQDIDAAIVAAMVRMKWAAYNGSGISAVIPVLNETPRLARCIEAVAKQVNEVVVVLDGKGTVSQKIRSMGVRVIEATGHRIGYGKTMMRAARQTMHRFILMLNDDCYMDPGSIPKMMEVMGPSVGVVGCQLRYPNGKIQHGGQYRPPGVIGFGHIDHGKPKGSIQAPMDMEAVTFAAAMVRREALYAVRGFDERYDCYSEDTDICLKMGVAGWRVVYQPLATGIHEDGQTSSTTKMKMIGESTDIFVSKWRSYLSSRKPII